MGKSQIKGMQKLPFAAQVTELLPISWIANNRMADSCQMHPDLVCAPGLKPAFHQRISAAKVLPDFEVRKRPASLFPHGHLFSIMRMAPNRLIDCSMPMLEPAVHQSKVMTLDSAVLHLGSQVPMCMVILGNHQQPAGAFIQTVNNPGAELASDS